MNALLSAVASDLIGRLVSFLVGKYQLDRPGATNDAVRLQRALLRARVVVEEAEGRQIANRAMLVQLSQLRRELCRAAYALDAFRCRAVDRNRRRRHAMASSDCGVMVESLEVTLRDMREFVVLLGGCPRMTRQPYSAYLFVESCMFGRQMEKEEIVGFLLSQPSVREDHLDVLPIIGPHGVGKRTLVEHVCLDKRVRERFAKVHRLSSDELDDLLHHPSLLDEITTARSLMVIDIVGGAEEESWASWRRFHSAAVRRRGAHSSGSKVIVISRTEVNAGGLGTAPPLRLRAPRREELWYFFRALAFGAADPDDSPDDLLRVAMALCARVCDFASLPLFAAVSIVAASLRADMSARAWRRVLKVYADATVVEAGYYYPCRPGERPCLFYNRRKLSGGSELLPNVTMPELLAGGCLPPAGEARFDVLMWQSRIPPYGSYVATCDMERARQVAAAGEKPARKRRRDKQDP